MDIIDAEGVKWYFEKKERLDDLMKQEETYWQQRAKAFWLTEGNTNSKNFTPKQQQGRSSIALLC